jgi:hypothetical protein
LPSSFEINVLCLFLICAVCATFTAYLILHLNTLIIDGKQILEVLIMQFFLSSS